MTWSKAVISGAVGLVEAKSSSSPDECNYIAAAFNSEFPKLFDQAGCRYPSKSDRNQPLRLEPLL